jgi:tetraacyldisaccharide 4'-kinase
MLGPTEFRDVVSGRRRGVGAAALRGLLRGAEVPYTIGVTIRNRRYDQGHAVTHRVSVPVISVGNLTLGGTGKTPMVKWLARHLQNCGKRVAIVSRGYGAADGQQNDEARELAQALPDVPHVQNRDRVAGAEQAIAEYQPDVILLDDGFQHRRLARDLDIVLLDALEPFGFEHVFPRGMLREPASGLSRAQAVCLSRADVISADQRAMIMCRVGKLAPHAIWCELAHAPSQLVNADSKTRPLDWLAGRRIAAFCGIGNPAGFRHTLAATGCDVAVWREFADHHAYTPADASELSAFARDANAEALICTRKDLVKLDCNELGGVPIWAVEIEMQFLSGEESFRQLPMQAIKKVSGVRCQVSEKSSYPTPDT